MCAQVVDHGPLGHLVHVELGVAAGRVAVDLAGEAAVRVGEEFGADVLAEFRQQLLQLFHRVSSARKRFSSLSQISSACSIVRISGGRILRTLP